MNYERISKKIAIAAIKKYKEETGPNLRAALRREFGLSYRLQKLQSKDKESGLRT